MQNDIILHGGRPVRLGAKMIVAIAKPGEKLEIKGRANNNSVDYSASGSTLMKDFSEVHSKTLQYEIKKDENAEKRTSIGDQTYYANQQRLNGEINKVKEEFIRANSSSETSAIFVIQLPDYASFSTYYGLLTTELKTDG